MQINSKHTVDFRIRFLNEIYENDDSKLFCAFSFVIAQLNILPNMILIRRFSGCINAERAFIGNN